MATVGQRERATQNRVVRFFQKELGYRSLGNREKRAGNSNIETADLRPFLVGRGTPEALIERALYQLGQAQQTQTQDLYDANEAVYGLLRYGVQVKPDIGEQTQTVHLIDWTNVLANDFAIAEEVTVSGQHDKRPDIALYINGVAVGILELKRASVSVGEGIRQNISSQKKEFIQHFFSTVQLVMAGNDTEGLRYGTTQTPEKYFLSWKGEDPAEGSGEGHLLDRQLGQLCRKERLLEVLLDFVAFDMGTKKLCRPNQYFGVKAAQNFVRDGRGGVIWHTQGSGKSLTMVWLARWILENVTGSRVLLITDRTELDGQIEGVFLGVGEQISRTGSGAELLNLLASANPRLICSLVHKFGTQEEGDVAAFVESLQSGAGTGFKAHGRVFVFVDECHRTQSGKLHDAMKKLLPGAPLFGFTGTPLLKADKKRSVEVFGPYIHTYRYDEAVRDGVVLDLKYEARDIDQNLTAPGKIDQWFEVKTRELTPAARSRLKQKWGTMQKVLSAQDRLRQIVSDIMLDMELRPRLASGRGNAMLVTGSIYQACKLYALFLAAGFDRCAIVTSYRPHISDVKTEDSGAGMTEKLSQYEIYNRMLAGKTPEQFEKDVKEKFIRQPGQMRLLIVVDKLLTGFDAPSATCLYIDKKMRDHALFQAICRVNRLDGEDKEYGYVVDYKDLFGSLGKAVKEYTSGAFDDYDDEDVQGLLQDRLQTGRARLEDRLEELRALCEPVAPPRDQAAHMRYFCGDPAQPHEVEETQGRRSLLYKLSGSLLRAYADLAGEMEEAGYAAAEAGRLRGEVAHFEKLSEEMKLASGDAIDFKRYEADMRHLLDTYIRAEESRPVSAFEDMTLIDLLVQKGVSAVDDLPADIRSDPGAVAETIENNVRRVINSQQPVNPKFYEKMSVLLDELIQQRKADAAEYEAHLAQLADLAKQIKGGEASASYPVSLNTPGKRALYDNLGQDEAQALQIDAAVRATRKHDWRGHRVKESELRRAIRPLVKSDDQISVVMNLIREQAEY